MLTKDYTLPAPVAVVDGAITVDDCCTSLTVMPPITWYPSFPFSSAILMLLSVAFEDSFTTKSKSTITLPFESSVTSTLVKCDSVARKTDETFASNLFIYLFMLLEFWSRLK